ncbi:hypothetical protein KR067_000018 [Drosophila pandora]|nr:hypothetical protein KR067_000018 [Drosophila pandora]
MEYSVAAFLVFVLALCLGHSVWAAPSAEDLAQFGELEKTIKELTNSILAMSGGASGTFHIQSDIVRIQGLKSNNLLI